MKTTIRISAVIVIMLLITGLTSYAQQNQPNRNGKGQHQRQMAIPNLSQEQKDKIGKIKLEQQKLMLPLKNQLMEKKAHLRTLETAEKADIVAINKTIDEIAVLQTTMQKQKAKSKQDIRALLTEEQRIAFDTRMQRKENKLERNQNGNRGKDGKCNKPCCNPNEKNVKEKNE